MPRLLSSFAAAFVLLSFGGVACAEDLFGAIGYSPSTGAYSAATRPSRAAAEQTVLVSCRRHASDCSAPVWVRNGCVALAIGQARGFGTGWGSTRASAQEMALRVCRQNTSDCQLERMSCTGE